MTLIEFLINEKICVNGPEVQAYATYRRITVNDEEQQSPWRELLPGDIVTLRTFNTHTNTEGAVVTKIYEGELNDSNGTP